jgi:hypothetical protein
MDNFSTFHLLKRPDAGEFACAFYRRNVTGELWVIMTIDGKPRRAAGPIGEDAAKLAGPEYVKNGAGVDASEFKLEDFTQISGVWKRSKLVVPSV